MFSMSMSLKWDAIRSRFPVFFPHLPGEGL